MNLLFMKYAVEVASAGSISKAAERLYIDQPNLSRAIKSLETSLDTTLFERSAHGVKLTPSGETFISYARKILGQVDAMETMFRSEADPRKHFSISVPRASYISEAFALFSLNLAKEREVEVFYQETDAMRVIKNTLRGEYKLGVVRYAANQDRYYKEMLEEKGLVYELITEYRYALVMREDSPLAQKERIGFSDLADLIEITHADPSVPFLPLSEVKKEELPDIDRRIYVFERGSQFDLLSRNPDTFMWVSPMPKRLLERYGLVQRECAENRRMYKDVMVYRKDYHLSELDKQFISELCREKREIFQ